jgi:hypothetical protein
MIAQGKVTFIRYSTVSAAVFQGSRRPNLPGYLGTADASLNGAGELKRH